MSSDIFNKQKKAISFLLEVIIGGVLILALIFIIIYVSAPSIAKAAKTTCFSIGDIAKGSCIEKEEDCLGTTNKYAKCPEKTPFCCLGEVKSKAGETPATGGQAPLTPVSTTKPETPQVKGVMEFYCKCKIDKDLMIITDTFSKLEIKDIKKDNVDFKATAGIKYELQARGTEEIKYCRISIAGQNKQVGGDCSKDKGPSLSFTFPKTGDFDINLNGYDKQGGAQIASAVVDIKAGEGLIG